MIKTKTKNAIRKLFDSNSIFILILKKILIFLIIKKIIDFKLSTLVKNNLTERPAYLYCIYNAALLAKKLGHKKISVIEFGVAGGNGIMFLEKYSEKILKEINVKIEIFGFDLREGLNEPKDYRDLPYWFKKSLYKMDYEKLNSKLKNTKLIIGDVKNTIKDFFINNNPPPIGVILNDLDYYSSTKDSFEIFNQSEERFFLPRIFCYFDDVIGTEKEMYGINNGELLAIEEFNKENDNKKINLNQNLLNTNFYYRLQIYYFHNFIHKDYNKFIYENEQSTTNQYLKIK